MKRFSKNLVAASLTFGLVLTVVVETQADSRFGGSRGSSSRGSISSRTRSSSVRRITPTRTQTRTPIRTRTPTRNVVKRPTTSRPIIKPTKNTGIVPNRRPQGIKLSDIKRPTTRLPTKRPSSPLKQGVKKSSFFGGHHNNHNGHNGHHNSHHNNHGHRRHFWFNFGRHVYYRPYIRNYCWGYVPRCNPTQRRLMFDLSMQLAWLVSGQRSRPRVWSSRPP